MHRYSQLSARAHWLGRWLSAGCASLILALSIFAASPAAHQALHEDDHAAGHAEEEHGCAVAMFAGGVGLPVAPLAIFPPATLPLCAPAGATRCVDLIAPRYLRQPERGPPVNRDS